MHGSFGTLLWIICYFGLLLGLSVYGVHRYFILVLYLRCRRRPLPPPGPLHDLPIVTIQLPIYNEIYVVDRLLKAVSEISYPKEKLQIQVLDDSTDETRELTSQAVARLQLNGFDAEVVRRPTREGFKAGALEFGLERARGEFFLILDADFVPPPQILERTIHFFSDQRVGMIQTRWGHINRAYSFLTRAQAILLDGHLVLEQTARSRSGRFFNFNGTAGLWRKSCIEEAGGWQHDTLTEDLDLSYRAQLKGWKFLFLNDIVTPAELPVDMGGFKSQQHRWTKGSIQTCKKMLPKVWASRLPWWIKLEATAHLTSNFAYLLLALLCIVLQPGSSSASSAKIWGQAVLIDVPILLATTVSASIFYLCAQRELYPRRWWRDILFFPFVLALGTGLSVSNARAVLEAVFNQKSDFTRTPKYGVTAGSPKPNFKKYSRIGSLLPFVELLFAAYFTYLVISALQNRQYLSVPFLLLFQIGFGYVACRSLWERYLRWQWNTQQASLV